MKDLKVEGCTISVLNGGVKCVGGREGEGVLINKRVHSTESHGRLDFALKA